VVVIPDYIKYPKVTFPQWQFDAAKAVAWTLDNIDEYGGDKNNVIIMGHSAGAHIGVLLVADRQYLTKVGVNNTSIKGFVGLAGPYHFTPQARSFKQMFGPEENYPLMQVSTFINGSEPPMLLLWGKDDSVVSEQNIINFSASLQQHNNRYEIIAYEDKGHVGMIADFSSWRKQQSKILADIDQFIDTLP
jgi:Esterase/lipase